MAGDGRPSGAPTISGESVGRSGLGLERISREDLERAFVAMAGEAVRGWVAELAAMRAELEGRP